MRSFPTYLALDKWAGVSQCKAMSSCRTASSVVLLAAWNMALALEMYLYAAVKAPPETMQKKQKILNT